MPSIITSGTSKIKNKYLTSGQRMSSGLSPNKRVISNVRITEVNQLIIKALEHKRRQLNYWGVPIEKINNRPPSYGSGKVLGI